MPTESLRKVTCCSEDEGGFMSRSQAVRGALLRPLLLALVGWGVTPGQVTLLSLLTGLASCPVYVWGSKSLSFLLLLAHVLLDGVDGPLARLTGRASNRGSFNDSASDQAVVTCHALALAHAGTAGIWPAGLYLSTYGIVVCFAMVRNAMGVPYSWLFRPRFLVYAWVPVELYLWHGSLDVLLWGLTGLLGLKTLTGFLRIRRAI